MSLNQRSRPVISTTHLYYPRRRSIHNNFHSQETLAAKHQHFGLFIFLLFRDVNSRRTRRDRVTSASVSTQIVVFVLAEQLRWCDCWKNWWRQQLSRHKMISPNIIFTKKFAFSEVHKELSSSARRFPWKISFHVASIHLRHIIINKKVNKSLKNRQKVFL